MRLFQRTFFIIYFFRFPLLKPLPWSTYKIRIFYWYLEKRKHLRVVGSRDWLQHGTQFSNGRIFVRTVNRYVFTIVYFQLNWFSIKSFIAKLNIPTMNILKWLFVIDAFVRHNGFTHSVLSSDTIHAIDTLPTHYYFERCSRYAVANLLIYPGEC